MTIVFSMIAGYLGYVQVQINSIDRSYEFSDATSLKTDIASEVLLKADDSVFVPVESHSKLIIGGTRTNTSTNHLSELKLADTAAGVAMELRTTDNASSASKLEGTFVEYVSPDDIRALERFGSEPRDIGAFVDPSTLY